MRLRKVTKSSGVTYVGDVDPRTLPGNAVLDGESWIDTSNINNVLKSFDQPNDTWTSRGSVYGGDFAAPTISLSSPTNAPFFGTAVNLVTLAGTCIDDVSVTSLVYTITGVTTASGPVTLDGGGNFSFDVTFGVGESQVTFIATDSNGNISTKLLRVNFDAENPQIAITAPSITGSFISGQQTVQFAGTAVDAVGIDHVSYEIVGPTVTLSGTATGTTNWSFERDLELGNSTVTVTAFDAGNNQASAQIVIGVDLAAPTIAINVDELHVAQMLEISKDSVDVGSNVRAINLADTLLIDGASTGTQNENGYALTTGQQLLLNALTLDTVSEKDLLYTANSATDIQVAKDGEEFLPVVAELLDSSNPLRQVFRADIPSCQSAQVRFLGPVSTTPTGAVTELTFDSISGDTVNNTGTAGAANNTTNVNGCTFVSGKSGNGVQGNVGAGAHLLAPANMFDILAPNQEFTLAVDFKIPSYGTYQFLFGYKPNTATDGGDWFYAYINDTGSLRVAFGDNNGRFCRYNGPSGQISLNAWHNLVLKREGTAFKVYLNSAFLANTETVGNLGLVDARSTGVAPWLMGQPYAGEYFGGIMDNFRIWDRALTLEETQSLGTIPSRTIKGVSVQDKKTALWNPGLVTVHAAVADDYGIESNAYEFTGSTVGTGNGTIAAGVLTVTDAVLDAGFSSLALSITDYAGRVASDSINLYRGAFGLQIDTVTDTLNLNIESALLAAGWDGNATPIVDIHVYPGVKLGSSSTSTPALVTGTLPASAVITLVNEGYIVGAGGQGGQGGGVGLVGGDALHITAPITINNQGTIAAGGKGGNAGAYSTAWDHPCSGGGGGGAGFNVGQGGLGGAYLWSGGRGASGLPGTLTLGGAGGDGGGSDDGGWWISGNAGAAGSSLGVGGSYYLQGSANVTWVAPGTRLGSVS